MKTARAGAGTPTLNADAVCDSLSSISRSADGSTPAYLETLPDWATTAERAYLRNLPDAERRVLDAYVDWLAPIGSWRTFGTATFSDSYADRHRGLYTAKGASKWMERFLDGLHYDGAEVIAPEGHRWRNVYHVHFLAEYLDWRALHAAHRDAAPGCGLKICPATAGALAYSLKYALKRDLSEFHVIRLGKKGLVER